MLASEVGVHNYVYCADSLIVLLRRNTCAVCFTMSTILRKANIS